MTITTTSAEPRSSIQRYWFDIPLWKRILTALALGVVVGLLWGEGASQIRWIGDIFVRLTRMIVAPLVFVTITAGVVALGDPKRLGSLGARTLGVFLFSALLSASVGLGLGLLFKPGVGVDVAGATPQIIKASKTVAEQLLGIIPLNPIAALAEGDMLAIIFFAIFFGAGVLSVGERAKPVVAMINGASDVMLQLIRFVIEVAPFGVFGLIAASVGTNGPGVFVNVSLLAMATLIGSVLIVLVLQPLIIRLLAGLPGLAFLRGSFDAMLVAFSTSSSSASLPVEMAVAEKNLGIKKPVLSTVLPVGVSIGRDGSAMYVALLSLFGAQALGIVLTPVDLLLILFLSALIALSAPPVPSAALFMMSAVLSSVGITDVQSAIIVGFILPFDRFLDMMRTVPNVMSNLTAATVVARHAGEIDVETFKSKPVK
jgi:Na+/H+-dicarboxylate symporter